MARLPYLDLGKSTPLNILKLLAHSSATFPQWAAVGGAQFKSLSLSTKQRELIILLSTAKFKSTYEYTHHIPVSKKAGVSDEQRAEIDRAAEQEGYFAQKKATLGGLFSPEELALLVFVEAVIDGPEVSEEVWQSTRATFSERAIVEMITVQGFYYTFGRLTTVLKVDMDGPPKSKL